MMCVLDPKWRFVEANDAWAKNTGYPHDEIIGSKAWKYLHPDDLKFAQQASDGPGAPRAMYRARFMYADGEYRFG